MKRIGVVLGLLLALAGLPACGGESGTETVVVTETQEAPLAETVQETTTEDAIDEAADSAIPDVLGQRLDVAESALDDLGILWEEVGGGAFGVVDASAWVVCDQQPKPGAIEASVKLIVGRPGECSGAATAAGGAANKGRVPDVVGKRLDVAQSTLDDRRIVYEIIGGGTFGVVNPSAWVVCDQQPGPGKKARRVKLIVDREGSC